MVRRRHALLRDAQGASRSAERKRRERRHHRLQNFRSRRRHSSRTPRRPRPRRRVELRKIQIRLGKTIRVVARSGNGASDARRNPPRRLLQRSRLLIHVRPQILLHELFLQSGRIQQASPRHREERLFGTGGAAGFVEVKRALESTPQGEVYGSPRGSPEIRTVAVERGRSRPRSSDGTGGLSADPDDRELPTARTVANKGEPQTSQRVSRIVGESQREIVLSQRQNSAR